jgi:hypothetical protein
MLNLETFVMDPQQTLYMLYTKGSPQLLVVPDQFDDHLHIGPMRMVNSTSGQIRYGPCL